jgi:hypothetical protein
MATDNFELHYVGLSLGKQTQNGSICFINNEKKVVPACGLSNNKEFHDIACRL